MNDQLEPLLSMSGGRLLEPGSVVLLRGAPGAGKTTLALQSLAEHLRTGGDNHAAFVSLEKDPMFALRHLKDAFGIDCEPFLEPPRLVVSDRKAIQAELCQQQLPNADFVAQLIGAIMRMAKDSTPSASGQTDDRLENTLIVIDSLNILTSFVASICRDFTMRTIFYDICSALQAQLGNGTVLLTGEYDPSNPRALSAASESFSCDTLVQLQQEPVTVLAGELPSTRRGPANGNIRKTAERRFFCRVLKCRTGARQERRCCYDIVSNRGVVFFETYPGDGEIMLFAENSAQADSWRDFFERDIPKEYPALAFQTFGRSGLQRVFASLRRLRHVPYRTEMNLASYDTYWVNWYVELCQRWDIADRFRRLPCGFEQSAPDKFSQVVGIAHKALESALAGGRQRSGAAGPSATWVKGVASDILTRACKHCDTAQQEYCGKELPTVLGAACKFVSSEEGQSGLLHPLPWSELRLFGERRSQIVSELETARPAAKRPLHRLGHKETAKLLAVPYDANIGFLVVREDLLPGLKELRKNHKRIITEMVELWKVQEQAVKEFRKEANIKSERLNVAEGDVEEAAKKLLAELPDRHYPETWEELIVLCSHTKTHFLIETQTFDTFLCTLLELVWGCGGEMRIHPDYTIENYDHSVERLFSAFWLMRIMFEQGVTPANSALEPRILQDRFTPCLGKGKNSRDWLFARHWYSTLVDVLIAKREDGAKFIWKPGPSKKVCLGIAPIPVNLHSYIESRRGGKEPEHHSCWGEWYLAVTKGTENEALALALINNLMSSQKVAERALNCACVPTVEDFYTLYGHRPCFDLLERDDMELPKVSFAELKGMLFPTARSRSQIFDYRHCMRELHAVLESVRTDPDLNAQTLARWLLGALDRIKALASKELLLR